MLHHNRAFFIAFANDLTMLFNFFISIEYSPIIKVYHL